MRLLRTLVYGNVWVALAAPSMLWVTALQFSLKPEPVWFFFVFFATLFTYNMQRLFMAGRYLSPQLLGRHAWIMRYRKGLFGLTFSALLALVFCLFFIPLVYVLYLLPSGFFSLLYVLPVWGQKRLRDLPFVKIILVAFTWSWALVAAPSLVFGLLPQQWLPLFGFEFLLCFGLTVPFDVRDAEHDREVGTRTFVTALGLPLAKKLSLFCFVLAALFVWLGGMMPVSAFMLLLLAGTLAVWYNRPGRSDLYYGFALDGIFVVQGLVLYGVVSIVDML